MKERTMTTLPKNDENETKQLKAVYLECYKTVCGGMRRHVYTQSSGGYLYLKICFQKYLKIEDIQLAACMDCFLIFKELFSTPRSVTATEVSWKQSAPVGHTFLVAVMEVHSMLTEKTVLSQGCSAGAGSLGKAPAQQWLCFAEVVSLWMVYAWLSAALWHLLRKRIICEANYISTSHLKMKAANFKTIPNENPTYTMWHSHAGKKRVKTGIIQN